MPRQPPRFAVLLALLAGAAVLAACSRAPIEGFNDYILTRDTVAPGYAPADLRLRHGGGTMPVVVHGGAFGRDGPALAGIFAGHMTGHSPGVATTFVAADAAAAPESRIAVQMAPPASRTGHTLCAGEGLDETASTPKGRTAMLIAYCLADAPRSWARLSVAARRADSPPVRRGLELAMQRLLPARTPNAGGPDSCRRRCD